MGVRRTLQAALLAGMRADTDVPAGSFFAGNLTDVYKQIGNAVPVAFAEAIAKSVRSALLSEV